MKLEPKHKRELTKLIMDQFGMTPRDVSMLINSFQKLLYGKNQQLLHDMNYSMFVQNNIVYTQKILNFTTMVFTYLCRDSNDSKSKDNLEKLFLEAFDKLFIKRCDYAKKSEVRGDATQKILLHTSKRLSETLETQELMIANISHEMRTSLNAIHGYIAIVDEKNNLIGEDRQFLKKANKATVTLKALVSDILNVTKINSGQLEMQKEIFWIDEMLLKCIDTVSMELKKRSKIRLETDIDFIPDMVYGYQTHIMEIIINLLSNAIKYTDSGFIKISTKVLEHTDSRYKLLFSVQDSGIGMTSDELEKIFSPYSRFQVERQGLGLGLYIAKELSKKMDGNIDVTSKSKKGSTFDFTLTIDKHDKSEIDIHNKKICFLIDGIEPSTFEQKIRFLTDLGTEIIVFHEEPAFINYLLTLQDGAPDIISISTKREGYIKNDALIYYLKTLSLYSKTIFVAEHTMQNISLNYFDEIHDFFAPISAYISKPAIHISHQKRGKTDISILVVDDIETNQEIFKMFVQKRFPKAIIDMASGGYEAMGMFKVKEYDLILLDLKMPGMNGFEVIDELKIIKALPTIYAFTADVYKSNYEKVYDVGFNGIIEKPLQLEKLYAIIQGILDEKYN